MFYSNRCVLLPILVVVFLFNLNCHANENIEDVLERYQGMFRGGLLRHLANNIHSKEDGNLKDCQDDLDRLRQVDLLTERWALEMLDAGGRPPHGLLKGNMNSVGQFEECLGVSHKRNDSDRTIRGKYCLARIPLPFELLFPNEARSFSNINNALQIVGQENQSCRQTSWTFFGVVGVCAEDKFWVSLVEWYMRKLSPPSPKNVQHVCRHLYVAYICWLTLVNLDVSGLLMFNLAICMPSSCRTSDVEPVLQGVASSLNISISLPPGLCTMDVPRPWSAGEIVALCFFGLIGVLLLLSTLYDLWFVLRKGEKESPNVLLASFSMYTNSKRLTTLSKDPGPLACLHGIRVLSMFWIILGHRYIIAFSYPVENLLGIFDWMDSYWSMAIVGSTISVDTFFLLSGVLLSYTFFRQTGNRSLREIPMFYFHRFLRLTPALAAMILIQITIVPKIGRGPFWSQLNDVFVNNCKEYWWSTLLYVQNYVNVTEMCLGQSWYLSVDMQLFILSPLILYPILKNAKVGLSLAAGWIVASLVLVFVICYSAAWTAASLPLNDPNAESRQSDYYMATHTRATPWLVGVFAGYFLRIYASRDIKINKVIVVLGWMASLAVIGAVVLGMQPIQSSFHQFSYLQDTTYLAFSRTAWAVGVLWVIVACFFGYGGPVNWFLSLRLWEFLARLTYSMYLLHLNIQNMVVSNNTTITSFAHIPLVHLFLGDLLTTIVMAYFMVLAFESPVTVLEKYIFKTGKTKSTSQEHLVIDPEQQNIVPEDK